VSEVACQVRLYLHAILFVLVILPVCAEVRVIYVDVCLNSCGYVKSVIDFIHACANVMLFKLK